VLEVRARARELRATGGFLRGLGPFLGRPPDLADARRRLDRQTAARERTFADVLQRAVFGNPASPYRRLFEWAGIGPGDVATMLAEEGLDGSLERLHDAGVYVTLEEFKGLRPLRRPGLEVQVRAGDFDNPLTARQYEARTGGSTGAARPIRVDLDLLEHEAAYHALFFAGAGATEQPLAIWHLAPPGAVGIKTALIQARLGRPAERWFSQSRLRDVALKHAAFARATISIASLWGARIPAPEYTPAEDVLRVASWLADKRASRTPAILVTTPSACVRTCGAAIDGGLDIAGTLFVVVGEPYTPAKAAVVAKAGSRAASHYAMTEAGLIGLACQTPEFPDDVHLLVDKIATIQRDKRVGAGETTVPALFHTTLLPASPKLMLNVESGDYAVRSDRECGCHALPGRFQSHLHTIRSYEKLTSEGMHFLGDDLLSLVEDLLPARFGGHPTDYQFVEKEEDGLPRVSLVVRRAVGELDPDRIADLVLEFLRGRGQGQQLMAEVWAQGRTLRVERGDPRVTPGGKIPPLRTLVE
jgi:hypothetical protein